MTFSLRNRPNFTIDSYLDLMVFVLYSFNLSSNSPIAIYHNMTSSVHYKLPLDFCVHYTHG
jgi:hypothetical protein